MATGSSSGPHEDGEAVLAWECQDVDVACHLPVVGSARCLNMVPGTQAGMCCTSSPSTSRSVPWP